MVRGKTPKVTYYSNLAKCQLMETLDDFEVAFYDGGKITKTSRAEIKMVDGDGKHIPFGNLTDDTGSMQAMYNHYQHCLDHCQTIERLLRDLHTNGDCFPIIVGRRPASAPVLSSVKESNSNLMTPKLPNVSLNSPP